MVSQTSAVVAIAPNRRHTADRRHEDRGRKFSVLHETEVATTTAWWASHDCWTLVPDATYSLTYAPTGIGDKVTATCSFCGEKKDVSNYGLW